MTMLGTGILAGAALLGAILLAAGIMIARDRADEDDIDLQEYDDWERLRGPDPGAPEPRPARDAAQPRDDGDPAAADAASRSGAVGRGLRPAV
jgi:hypothetical protein